MHHPFVSVRAAPVWAVLLFGGLLAGGSPAAAPVSATTVAQSSCAALGTYRIDQPLVPRTLSLHRAPPAQAARIPARWFLRGQLTLTAYTGCGRPCAGRIAHPCARGAGKDRWQVGPRCADRSLDPVPRAPDHPFPGCGTDSRGGADDRSGQHSGSSFPHDDLQVSRTAAAISSRRVRSCTLSIPDGSRHKRPRRRPSTWW